MSQNEKDLCRYQTKRFKESVVYEIDYLKVDVPYRAAQEINCPQNSHIDQF